MNLVQLLKVNSDKSLTVIPTYKDLSFDVQSAFRVSTIQFSLSVEDAETFGVKVGVSFRVKADGVLLDTAYVLESLGRDFVTENGIPFRSFKGRSKHVIFEDDVVLPSAWPNPTPSGHNFQNASAGNILKTLISRAQSRGTLADITTNSFSGTADSNGTAWARVMDRSYSAGDTLLSVIQGLVDTRQIDAKMVGDDLRVYPPDTLQRTIPPSTFVLRAAQNLSEGTTEEDSSDFATDIFAVGEGTAAVQRTRPAAYNALGRRRVRFSNYGGIADVPLLTVLADAELDMISHIKREDSLAISHDVLSPFSDYAVGDWVSLSRGGETLDTVQIQQISVQVSDKGDITVGVSLGDLLDSADEKLKRRIDAITGANAGGGSVPSDKGQDKTPPARPSNTSIASTSYIDPNSRRKVLASVDWSDVTTNADGTSANDIDHYEVRYRTSRSAPSGTPTTIKGGRPNLKLNTLFDRRSKPVGWIGGDGVASTRASTGKDYWFFGDSGIGQLDAAGKYVNNVPHAMVNNAIVRTDPANVNIFDTFVGKQNKLVRGNALGDKRYILNETNCSVLVSTEWTAFGGFSYCVVPTAAGNTRADLGQDFFGDNGSKPVIGGTQYTVTGVLRKNATPRAVTIGLRTYDSTGASTITSAAAITESATADLPFAVVITVPGNAVKGNVTWAVTSPAAGEKHWVSRWGWFEGDARSQTWNYDGAVYDALLKPHQLSESVVKNTAAFEAKLFREFAQNVFVEKRSAWIGDSISEGALAPSWQARAQTIIQSQMRALYDNKVTAVGYIPAKWGGWTPDATTLSSTGATYSEQQGLGSRAVNLTNGGWVEFQPQLCSEIDVCYSESDFFAGRFEVFVDGVKERTIETYSSTAQGGRAVRVRIKFDTEAYRTIRLVAENSTNTSIVHGIEYRNGSNGLYLIDSSHSGWNLDKLIANDSNTQSYYKALRDANVTHVNMMLGANDMATYTPAEWNSKLISAVNRIRTELTAPGGWPIPITFWHWGELPNQPAANGAIPQSLVLYEEAAADAFSRLTNTEVVFLSRYFPSGRTGNTNPKWSSDGIHPNGYGHQLLADVVAKRTFNQAASNLIWLGSAWSSGTKIYSTGMQIGQEYQNRANLIPNPDMGSTSGSTAGLISVGCTLTAVPATDWAAGNSGFSVKVTRTATGTSDSYFTLGGDSGSLRLGMQPGKTYTISGWSHIKTAWTGPLQATANRVGNLIAYTRVGTAAYVETSGVVRSKTASGSVWHSVTFTVPAGATEAFLRFYHGSQNTTDAIYWDKLILEERSTAHVPGDYFDGNDLPSTGEKVYWTGTPDNSVSGAIGIATAMVSQRAVVAQWDAATMVLDKFDYLPTPDADRKKQWSNAAWVEGGYVYLFGQDSTGQPVLARTSPSNPFAAASMQIWNGTAWASSGTAARIASPGQSTAFSAISKNGSTYEGYYIRGFDPNIYRMTAPALTGPWTNDPTPLYKTPEYGGNVLTYIPRLHPQFDTSEGKVFGYSTNTWNWSPNAPIIGPKFGIGPAAALAPVDIATVPYGAIQTVPESKAVFSGFEPNTSFQAQIRTIDSSGLASPDPWTETTAVVLTGTPGETLRAPSKPIVSSMFQGVRIIWDGLDNNGNLPTGEWLGVEVHVSPDGADFSPTGATRVDLLPIVGGGLGGTSPVPGLAPGVAYWVKFVALGRDGGASVPSESDHATTAKLIAEDLAPKLITSAAIADGEINTRNLNVAAFSEQIVPNGNFEGGFEGSMPVQWYATNQYTGSGDTSSSQSPRAIGGSYSWQHTITPGNGRIYRSEIFSLAPKDIYYFSAVIKTSRALVTPNSVSVGLAWSEQNTAASFDRQGSSQTGVSWPITSFTGNTTAEGLKVEGQLIVPANASFGTVFLKLTPDTGTSTNVAVTIDDVQVKRVVGTANIANAAINNAQIANAAIDDAKISNLSAGKITAGVLDADVTIGKRIATSLDLNMQRVEINAAGVQAYNPALGGATPITSLGTDGGLVSRWFRTNTAGTRIEMGNYSNGTGSANIAFYPDTGTWHFPPVVGYGGGGAVNFPGVALHSGSKTVTDYNKYGLSMMGLDQKGGIYLTTGNLLSGSQSTTGCNITIDAGGATGEVTLKAGGADRAQMRLTPIYGQSSINLPGGQINFDALGATGNRLGMGSIAWAGLSQYHTFLRAVNGFRIEGGSGVQLLVVNSDGLLDGSGAWGTPRVKVRGSGSYVQWDSSGNTYINETAVKTFVIDHPVEEDKYLVHATNEMPEARVDYTGNARLQPAVRAMGPTGPDGNPVVGDNDVEIVLPDYFTALVDESTAVVMVTPYFGTCDDKECQFRSAPSLAASRVKDGRFRVKAVGGVFHPCVEFGWRVSAVRKDVEQFEVEPAKSSGKRMGDGPYTYFVQ